MFASNLTYCSTQSKMQAGDKDNTNKLKRKIDGEDVIDVYTRSKHLTHFQILQ